MEDVPDLSGTKNQTYLAPVIDCSRQEDWDHWHPWGEEDDGTGDGEHPALVGTKLP